MSATGAELVRYLRTLAAGQADDACTDQQLLERFVTQRDQASFAALVRRHGPMVLGVCRRVLGHDQDAEDAFQATFLILARKAGSIRKHESVNSWLYGVAYHVAQRLRAKEARRSVHERKAASRPTVDPTEDVAWREIRCLLDSEVARLPEQYRAPLVLCYLQGQTQDEAARQLEWSLNTLRRRLDRARRLLACRLKGRGLTLSAALAAPVLFENLAQPALPPLLVASTVRAGLALARGNSTREIVSAQVVALVEGGAAPLLPKKAGIALVLLASLTLSVGGLLAHRAVLNRTIAEAPAAPALLQPTRSAGKEPGIEIKGRVLDPDGKPFSGARLFLRSDAADKKAELPVRATTNKDGRFRFTAQATDFPPQDKQILVATAKGFGPDWIEIMSQSKDDITLRLVKDDIPIEGRVISQEGRPLSGVRVHVKGIERGDLDAWMKVILAYNSSIPQGTSSEILGASATAVTGKDGRFRLTGIGRERGVELRIRGEGIEWARLWAVTRPGPPRGWRSGQEGLYGASFEWVAGPCKPIIGTVRDKATGKPVMGIHVSSGNPPVGTAAALTDRQGRYRINGVGKRDKYSVGVWGVPYLDSWRDEIPDTVGLEPLVVDFQVQRGIAITGRLLDKTTRQPVQGWVQYVALTDNPNRKNFALHNGLFTTHNNQVGTTKPDGSFQVVALPGPGLLCVRTDNAGRYPAIRPDAQLVAKVDHGFLKLNSFQALVRVDPSESDPKSTTCDILLEPSRQVPE